MSAKTPATTASPGRRERNKQRVRENLYESAMILFADKGYDQTSIGEIAEHADVARGTFFNYFQRKEDLISAWGERRRVRLESSLSQGAQPPGPDAVSRLQHCMATLSLINEDEGPLVVPMLTAWVKAGYPLVEEPYVAKTFGEIIQLGCGSGEFEPELSAARVGHLLRDIYLGTLYRWTQSKSKASEFSLGEELQASLALLVDGIKADPRDGTDQPRG